MRDENPMTFPLNSSFLLMSSSCRPWYGIIPTFGLPCIYGFRKGIHQGSQSGDYIAAGGCFHGHRDVFH